MKCGKFQVSKEGGLIEQQQDLNRLLELSDLMLTKALDEQWESVADIQYHREELIRVFFDNKIEIKIAKVSAAINYMLESDKKLTKLGLEERGQLQEQINKIKQGKNAVRAYTA